VLADEVYGGKHAPPPSTERAQAAGRCGHVTFHTFPKRQKTLRWVVLLTLSACWIIFYPLAVKLRCITCAALYTCTEFAFTFLERGRPYTSFAQLFSNLLYVPVLLDWYGFVLQDQPIAYVLLFPINIWVLEIIVGHFVICLYGHNVAWCYEDYADSFCNSCFRLGHGPFWLGKCSVAAQYRPCPDALTFSLSQASALLAGCCIHC
jgi:hypothetical protein